MIRIFIVLGLLLAPQLARAEWYEASTPHFVVYANDDPGHLATYVTKLERFDQAMRALRGVQDREIGPAERVTVYVVHDAEDIERMRGYGVRGFYHPSVEGPAAFVPRTTGGYEKWDLDADSVLRHEYAHHFMFDNYASVALPRWFVEGYAEFHATAIIKDDGSVVFGQAPSYRAFALLQNDDMLSIGGVLNADSLKLDGRQTDILYGKGWLLIHFLTFEPSRQGQLAAYLHALNSGKSPKEAAGVFGDLKVLERELDRYVMKRTIAAVTIGAGRLTVKPPTIRKLTAGEAATMDIRIASKAGVDDKTAPPLFARARKAAAPFPNDPGAQLVLAETACDAHDYAACLAAANRVIAADPRNERAYVFQGRAIMAPAHDATPRDTQAIHTARKSFVAANRLDSDEPEALAYYYRSFIEAGEQPSENARAALFKALDLAPEDEQLRLEVVKAYLQAGDKPNARATLLPLAYAPHGGEASKRAAALVTAIDQGDNEAIDKFLHPPAKDSGKDKPAK